MQGARPTPYGVADPGSLASTGGGEAPRPSPGRRPRYTSINTPGWRGRGKQRGGREGRGQARSGCGRPRASLKCIFPHSRSLEWRLTCRSPRTARTHPRTARRRRPWSVRRGQWPQRGGLWKLGWGRPRAQCPELRARVLSTGPASPQCWGSSTGAARPGDCSAFPLPAAAPARAAGPGRGSEGGPGPAPPARPLLLALSLAAALPGVRTLGDREAPHSPLVSPRGPRGRDRSLCPRPAPARGSSGYRGGRDRTMEGGSSRREVVAADRRWGPGGGGRDAPSSFCSSRRRRRRPPECGRGLRGMSVQYGREPRPLPSAPPLGFSCRLAHNPGAAVARRLALLPLARAAARPAGPAHSGPLGGGVRGRRRGRGGVLPVAHARRARNVTKNRPARGI